MNISWEDEHLVYRARLFGCAGLLPLKITSATSFDIRLNNVAWENIRQRQSRRANTMEGSCCGTIQTMLD